MNRRTFVQVLAGAAGPSMGQTGRYDLLIRNGEVRDPSLGLRRSVDVGITGDRVAAIEPNIPVESAAQVIDARGAFVTPGLVDLHTHCFYGAAFGVEADPIAARSGCTTWVDAGTFSYDQAEGFRRLTLSRP